MDAFLLLTLAPVNASVRYVSLSLFCTNLD